MRQTIHTMLYERSALGTNQDRIDQFKDKQVMKICGLYQWKSAMTKSFMETCMRMKAGIGLEPKDWNKLSDQD